MSSPKHKKTWLGWWVSLTNVAPTASLLALALEGSVSHGGPEENWGDFQNQLNNWARPRRRRHGKS